MRTTLLWINLLFSTLFAAEIPTPELYLSFDGHDQAKSKRFRHDNLNRNVYDKVPLKYVTGKIGQARQLKVLGFLSGQNIGGMGGVTYDMDRLDQLRRGGTLSFLYKQEGLSDPFTEVRHHPTYLKYRRNLRNFVYLPNLPKDKDAEIISPAFLSIAGEAGHRPLNFERDLKPHLTDTQSWNHFVIRWNAHRGNAEIFINGKFIKILKCTSPKRLMSAVTLFKNLPGLVDECALWTRELDEGVISQISKKALDGEPTFTDRDNLPVHIDNWIKTTQLEAPETRLSKETLIQGSEATHAIANDWHAQPLGSSHLKDVKRAAFAQNGLWKHYTPVVANLTPNVAGSFADHQGYHLKYSKEWTRKDRKKRDIPKHAMIMGTQDISFPENWKGERAVLHVDHPFTTYGRDVFLPVRYYLNGKFIGEVSTYEKGFFELGPHLKRGEKNRLSFLLGRPGYRLLPFSPGRLSVSLHEKAKRPLFKSVLLRPKLAPNRVIGELELDRDVNLFFTRASLEIRDFKSGEILADLGASSLKRTAPGEYRVSHEWAKPVFWNPDQPRLLLATYRLHQHGKVVSRSRNTRFGFRVIEWNRGRHLHFNGHPFHMRGQSHNGIEPYVGGIPYYKLFGMNSSRDKFGGKARKLTGLFTKQDKLAYLDEVGHLAHITQPRLSNNIIYEPELCGRALKNWTRHFGNHPSWSCHGIMLMSYMPGPWGHPHTLGAKAGRDFDDKKWDYQFLRNVLASLRPYQSDLPIYSYRGGMAFDLSNSLSYYGHRFPLQSREEVPKYWSEVGDKPGINNEVGIPMSGDEKLWQRGQGHFSPSHGSSAIIEYGAQYFGDLPYRQISLEHAGRLTWADLQKKRSMVTGGPGEDALFWGKVKEGLGRMDKDTQKDSAYSFEKFKKVNMLKSPQKEDFLGLYHKHTLCAWRAYGYNYLIHTNFQPRTLLDAKYGWSKQAVATFRYNSPVLVFLAGKPGQFENKDHAFFSGEKITKQIVCKNDRFTPVTIDLEYELRIDGQSKDNGQAQLRLQPGQLIKHAIALQAPILKSKSKGEIVVRAKVNGSRKIMPRIPDHPSKKLHGNHMRMAKKLAASIDVEYGDNLSVEIFPKEKINLASDKKILLIDPHGETARLLDRAGLKYEKLERFEFWGFHNYDLIVFGRNSLSDQWNVSLMEWDNLLGKIFRRGAPTILIFEQDRNEVFGLQSERVQARNAFIRDPQNPILSGLANRDFSNWRGESNLLPPYSDDWKKSDWEVGVGYRFPARHHPNYIVKGKPHRFPLWSNQGMVATNAFLKPHTGSIRSLLDCGFDLLYSPLLEERRAKGRILYCSLDVTNRYGSDPAATRLTNQLLDYALTRDENQWRKVHVLNDSDLFQMVDLIDIDAKHIPKNITDWDSDSLVLVNLRNTESRKFLKTHRKQVEAYLNKGGRLSLFWGSSSKDLDFLPFKIGLQNRVYFKSDHPEKVAALRGLGPADLFFRKLLSAPMNANRECGETLVSHHPYGEGSVTLIQLDPEQLRKHKVNWRWQWPKAWRVISRTLYNLGAPFESATGPEGGRYTSLYLMKSPEFDPYRRVTW